MGQRTIFARGAYHHAWAKLGFPSRRFGVVQGSRIRPIDDFSESLVNHVVTCCEKIDVAGVDKIAAVSKLWARLLRDQEVVVALSNGEVLRGTRHEMFAKKDVRLVGRCFDLEAAYKQCPLSDIDAAVSVIAVDDPSKPGQLLYFRIHALPFGSVGSVVQFNRVAAGIRQFVVRALGVPAVNYYDDFPIIIPEVLAPIVDQTVKWFGDLSGWRWKGGEKDAPFGFKFKALGVVFHISDALLSGRLTVSNTPSRVTDICEVIECVLKSKTLRPAAATQLSGRLGFAASQLFGRTGSAVIWQLRRWASKGHVGGKLNEELLVSLSCWATAPLAWGHPRNVVHGRVL